MANFTVAMISAVVVGLLLAILVTISQHGTPKGKIVGYLSCAMFAVCPLFGSYTFYVIMVAALVMAAAGIIGHRERERLERDV